MSTVAGKFEAFSEIDYGDQRVQCAYWSFPDIEVFAVPFRYNFSPEKAIVWLDVVIGNRRDYPVTVMPRFLHTETLSGSRFREFSGWLVHDFTLPNIPSSQQRGFRFTLTDTTRELKMELSRKYSIEAPIQDEITVFGRDSFWKAMTNELDVAFWNPTDGKSRASREIRFLADSVLTECTKNPTLLRKLKPDVFERLVAEILVRGGFDVQLTAHSADGGVDIFAITRSDISPTAHIIQCKRYTNRVSVELVRELYGVKSDKGVNKAILVTTSDFTGPAIEFASRHSWELSLIDHKKLLDWIKSVIKDKST
jgi:hypothetical protein